MNTPLARARLVPYSVDKATGTREEGEPIELDFNPESLTFHYPAVTKSSAGQGCSSVQTPEAGHASLSCTALFDVTRPEAIRGASGPRPHGGAGASRVGDPDVRDRTRRLQSMLGRVLPGENPAKGYTFVSFQWGNLIFEGVLRDLSETVELFSAEGAALRSRVTIKIEEDQNQRERTPAGRVEAVKKEGMPSLPSLGLARGMALGLGGGMNLGFSAGAGLGLSLDAALGVFGGAALSAAFQADVDLGVALSGVARADAGLAAPGSTPTPWAPAGPAAGSAAAADAAAVQAARAAGRQLPDPAAALLSSPSASTGAASPGPASTGAGGARAGAAAETGARPAEPLPLTGAPPRRHPPLAGPEPAPIFGPPARPERPAGRVAGRPSWEGAPTADHAPVSSARWRSRW